MDDKLFNIKYVSEQTGLSAHVIRIWERRYSATTPDRSNSNRRLFSQNDIEKLKLLKSATTSGQSIGQIASLPIEKLQEISSSSIVEEELFTPEQNPLKDKELTEKYIADCLIAIEEFDSYRLEKNLRRASVDLGSFKMLTNLISPLMDVVGEKWRIGEMNPSNEHFASEIVKNYLKNIVLSSSVVPSAPVLIVTTPKGQIHDVGANIVATAAVAEGWKVIYLGANLDYNEITSTVEKNNADALALSIVHPNDDIYLPDELINLRKNLGDNFIIIIGGRASEGYKKAIDQIKAYHIHDLFTFRDILKNHRNG